MLLKTIQVLLAVILSRNKIVRGSNLPGRRVSYFNDFLLLQHLRHDVAQLIQVIQNTTMSIDLLLCFIFRSDHFLTELFNTNGEKDDI